MSVRLMMLSRTLVVNTLLLTLSACSVIGDVKDSVSEKIFGKEDPNPPAELTEVKPTADVKVLWSAKLGDTEGFDFTPAVDGDFVYAASASELVKINTATGVQQWRIKSSEKIAGGVGVGANVVLVGTAQGSVLAYDFTGKPVWKAKLSSEVLSVPRVFVDTVVVRAGDNHIYGLNINDGSRKWVYQRANPSLSLRSSAGLVVDSGAVYAGFAGGKMVSLRADNGNLLWEATVAQPKGVTEIERIADITSLPVVDGPVVYAVAYQGKIAAVDRTNGRVVWNRDISSYSGISAEDGKVFVSHSVGSVYSLDYTSGKTFWRQAALANRKLTAPVAMSSVIAVGDFEGYIHFLNRDDGAFAARVKTDNSAVMPQMTTIGSNQLFAQTRDGVLYAISIK